MQAALLPEHAWALDYLIASSSEDYVNKAVALGSDRGLYARVAQAVRASRAHAPLFDTQGAHHSFYTARACGYVCLLLYWFL